MAGRLEGKVAFITGVARGQGRSHAIRFAEEGADIIGVDLCADVPNVPYPMASRADLDETVALVEKLDRRMVAHVADVADRAALQAAVDDGVAQLGHLDIVLANAGICALGDYPPEAFFQAIDTLLVGVFNAASVAYPHLRDGASIIATGSVAALIPGATDGPSTGPGGRGYSYAKRSIAQYVRELSLTLAPRMIRVNALHPTNCNTDLLHNEPMYKLFRPDLESPTREEAEQAFPVMQAMPIPYVEPIDISNAALFLASDESRYVTGLQMRVDAGSVIKQLPESL
ncbi:MAG TPA: mycofactocin-coupled SDR family oxidoreductase [Jatrophihabitantaceae bacterium]|nr:mycofactocin-coupled SDR family oxidoreductase [Jatrophihabitantaceae bacterium]